MSIDYRYLLKMCMKSWIDNEGCCWSPEFQEDLTEEQKEAVHEIGRELDPNWDKYRL